MACMQFTVVAKNKKLKDTSVEYVWANNIKDVKKALKAKGLKFVRDITFEEYLKEANKVNRCKFCGKVLKLTNEVDTCTECLNIVTPIRTATMSMGIVSSYDNRIIGDYKLEGEQILCSKCGHDHHRLSNKPGIVLTSNPPIQVTYYICDKCGYEFGVSRQEKQPSESPATKVYL